MSALTDADLDELAAKAEAATPGPWHWIVSYDDTPAAPMGEPYECDDGWNEQYLGHASGEYAQVSLRTVAERPTSCGPLPRFLINNADEVSATDAAHIAAADPSTVLALIADLRATRALLREATVELVEAEPGSFMAGDRWEWTTRCPAVLTDERAALLRSILGDER